MPEQDPEDYARETETGYGFPLLYAQRPLCRAQMREDEDDEVLAETLVLPNLMIYFEFTTQGNVRFGQHIVCSPQAAEQFCREGLPEQKDYIDGCDCPVHKDRHMVLEDADAIG